MNKQYTINTLPLEYFHRNYNIFSFDVLNDHTPLALTIGRSMFGERVTIIGLDELGLESKEYNKFKEFLKSISLNDLNNLVPLDYDLQFVKKHYFIDMKVNFASVFRS